MKKLVSFLFLLFIIAGGGVPYWVGKVAEQQFEQFNQNLSPAGQVELLNSNYQRGWLNSQGESTFVVQTPSPWLAKDQKFTVQHKVNHGFLPIKPTTIQTTVSTNASWSLQSTADTTKLLDVVTVMGANGTSQSTVTTEPLRIRQGDNTLETEVIRGTFSFNPRQTQITGKCLTARVQWNHSQGQIIATGVTLKSQGQRIEMGWLLGASDTTAEKVEIVNSEDPEPLRLRKVHVTGNSEPQQDVLSVNVKSSAEQIEMRTDRYGPGYLDFEIRRLHFPTLQRLQLIITEAKNRNPNKPLDFTSVGALLQNTLTLLRYNPEIAVTRLEFKTGEGQGVTGKLRLSAQQIDPRILFNPRAWISGFTGQLEAQVPITALPIIARTGLVGQNLTQIQQKIDGWVKQGWLEKMPSGDYRTLMSLNQGQLRVNNQVVPLVSR